MFGVRLRTTLRDHDSLSGVRIGLSLLILPLRLAFLSTFRGSLAQTHADSKATTLEWVRCCHPIWKISLFSSHAEVTYVADIQ